MNEDTKIQRPELGEWLTVKEVIRRKMSYEGGRKKHWFPFAIEPVKMMYVGRRTLSNGMAEWIDPEVGWAYFPEEHFEAWMFVESEHRNPVYVLPETTDVVVTGSSQDRS